VVDDGVDDGWMDEPDLKGLKRTSTELVQKYKCMRCTTYRYKSPPDIGRSAVWIVQNLDRKGGESQLICYWSGVRLDGRMDEC